jgi:hypothetical protein
MQFSNCKLNSNFSDYYDNYLNMVDDGETVVFHRFTGDNPGLLEQMQKLKNAGFLTPTFSLPGVNTLLYAPTIHNRALIDYVCFLRNGDFKYYGATEKINLKDGEFVVDLTMMPDDSLNLRFRYVQIGTRGFFFSAKGVPAWPSLVDDGAFKLVDIKLQIPYAQLMHFRSPVFSIDFIPLPDGRLVAVGFNLAPHLKSMRVQDVISPETAAEGITASLAHSTLLESAEDIEDSFN